MWRRRTGRTTEETNTVELHPLRDAVREARIEAAERTGVVVDLRDAEIARLEIVNEALDPIFAEIPDDIDLFDRGISRGDTPRLWIDAVAHIAMGRDKRVYRFVQDARFGRQVLAESPHSDEIVDAVTKYLARRLIDRERALSGDEMLAAGARRSGYGLRRGRMVFAFVFGVVIGVMALFAAAWLAASYAPGP